MELKDELSSDIEVGYYEGRQSSKVWIVSNKDLNAMYSKFASEVLFWVQSVEEENNDSDDNENQRKKTRRQEKEEEVEAVFQNLQKKHGEEYSVPQLRLWARMIQCGTHDDQDNPPQVPMICGIPPKRPSRAHDSLTTAFTGAAEAIAKAFTPSTGPLRSSECSGSVGISPGKKTELRMKNLQQLRELQQLYEDNIITDKELAEQKDIVMSTLRKLS